MEFKNVGTIEIDTQRLLLRRFILSDCFDMLKNWIADPNIQHNYGEPVYDTKEKVKALLDNWIAQYNDNKFYRWAILSKENGENIGQIAFCRVYSEPKTAEVEYCISGKHSKKGYATEALKGVIEFAFKKAGFKKIEDFRRIVNECSGKVMTKAGMKITDSVARFEQEDYNKSNYISYAITNT